MRESIFPETPSTRGYDQALLTFMHAYIIADDCAICLHLQVIFIPTNLTEI